MLVAAWATVAVPSGAIAVSLLITPAQTIQTAGQSVQLNAGAPSLSTSGPATLELFGRTIPTDLRFDGPIRPNLRWAEITQYDQLLAGLQQPQQLGQDVRDGWRAYFIRQLVIAVIVAAVLAVASLALVRRRWPVVLIGAVLAAVVAGGADGAAIATTARRLEQVPQQVRTLDELVGRSPLQVEAQTPAATGPADTVVIGDSTAAGAGNPLVPGASADDTACRRSSDAYAVAIATVSRSSVVNLACTNASIRDGLFGSQQINGRVVRPQLRSLRHMAGVRTVIVSIGANEMHWRELMALCLVASVCDDSASAAEFQQSLDSLALDYYDLLEQLAALPDHPRVIVNQYYSPLSANPTCSGRPDLNAAKARALLDRLAAFNTVLTTGAVGFGFEAVHPVFDGHELCTTQSYVQGPGDGAPLHPNAAGELAIALADEQALARPRPATPSAGATPNPT